ncbi:MAG: MBL fold metallo-hydrolase [Oscillospiraceae bacterium]|nr:MBL fold metallo-hydrolase [Oscillospiraceae bacterium]
MQFSTLASSSSGNSTLVSRGDDHILIDAGISCRRIMAALAALHADPAGIAGVLITHEHDDHISGLATLCKKTGVPVYASPGAAEGIRARFPDTDISIRVISPETPFAVGPFTVRAFRTSHDAKESVGYRLTADGRSMALATDLGFVSEEVLQALTGVHAVILEANHDPDMLKYGPYPSSLKRRIASDRGHLSNRICGRLAAMLYESGTRFFVLAHLSQENNTPDLAREAVEAGLKDAGAVLGQNAFVYVAPSGHLGEMVVV